MIDVTFEVDEVKNIMVENIEEVLKRGEKIEVLVDKTDDLRNHVRETSTSAHSLSILTSCRFAGSPVSTPGTEITFENVVAELQNESDDSRHRSHDCSHSVPHHLFLWGELRLMKILHKDFLFLFVVHTQNVV